MARWRQDRETGKLVPIDEAAARKDAGVAIHGPIESFVSPLDGTVITDRGQLRDHMKQHNVVHSAEFSPEFLEEKRRERERLYKGEHTSEEKFRRKQEIYNNWIRAERDGGY